MALPSKLSYLLIVFMSASLANAEEMVFGYKGVFLGSSESDLQRKIKDASCYTNRMKKTRECVVRNTTYMNSDVDLVRFVLPNGKLASITIEFYKINSNWDFGMSSEENMQRSAPVTFVCSLDSNVNTLEKKYGPHHKDFF